MRTLIENLYGKLIKLGINPITLAKAISIFLIIVILIGLLVTFPVLFIILLIIAVCILTITLIYLMLEIT